MRHTITGLVLLCSLFTATSADAQSSAADIRTARRPIPDQYIVVLASDDDPEAVAGETASNFQGRIRHVYRSRLRGFAARLTRAAAAALARDPRVLYVEEDGVVTANETIQASAPWGLDRIDQRPLPLNTEYRYSGGGTGVHAFVIDSGLRTTHTEFGGRAFIAGDHVDDDGDGDPHDVGNDDANSAAPDGQDCHGHGTHVAGTIGGATYGVAKNVTLWAHRVLDCTGSGSTSGVIAAIDAITADTMRRPAVVNMSLGGGASFALDDAVRRSIAAGVTYVVSAGNESVDAAASSPARVAEAITVGASSSTDARASWSNFGAVLDLFAPGVSIRSAAFSSDTGTTSMSGTSMAAPHVAGVAALYLEQIGNSSPLAVRDALVSAATVSVVTNAGTGSPNLLLYSGFGDADTETEAAVRTNVALAANGATATASSADNAGYAPGHAINGDRRGINWGNGGGWRDRTPGSFPDWLEITFAGPRTIDEVGVFSVQDTFQTPIDPTTTTTFSKYGLVDFTVQYWTGTTWATVPGGAVRGNALVWRTVTFPAVTSTRIRVLVERAVDGVSRIVEVEAYGTAAGPVNAAPSVTLTAPATGATFVAPATLTVSATASDSDGTVAQVAFYANGTLIGTDTVGPFTMTWSGVAAGSYSLTAVATDNAGATTTSSTVAITVTADAGTPPARTNVALAANGATATASSTDNASYAPATAINGERRGVNWGNGGGWRDRTPGSFPDWLEVTFTGPRTIDEVAVFAPQDAYKTPADPTPTMTFSKYGLVDFTVQYWTGTAWAAVPGGAVRGNTLVWRRVSFPAVTTARIRVLAERAVDGTSRIVEVEAYEAASSGPSTEWFVAPGGAGSGTSTAPFGSIQSAIDVAQPGDTVTVRPGTYAEKLATVRSGSQGSPIRVRPESTRGSVVVTAPGRVLDVFHPYVTVEGLVLDGQYGPSDTVKITDAGHYFTLRNAEVRRSTADLIDMDNPHGVLIENCLIHHALNATNGRTDAHGIVAGAVEDLTVRQTEIHTFSGDGLQVDPSRATPGWNRVTIEGSRIWLAPLPAPENGFAAGVVPGENAVDTKSSPSLPRASIAIRDSVMWGFRNGLIGNMAALNLKENIEATVDRVTVYDSEIAFRLRGPTSTTPAGARVTLTNAVIYDVATAFRYEDDIEKANIWNVTLGRGVATAFQDASSSSSGLDVRNLLSISPLEAEAAHSSNLQVGTAAFVNAGAHDYVLAPGSAAIDAGDAIAGVTTDRVGVTRPQGSGYDVGAYERAGS